MNTIIEPKKIRLTLRYDGGSADGHAIDAKTLAEAISGFADLVTQAELLINGESSYAEVDVVSFPDGCFGTLFEIAVSPVANHIDVLQALGVVAATSAAGKIGTSLIERLIQSRGKSIKHKQDVEGESILVLTDGNTLAVTDVEEKLITDKTIRTAVEKVFYSPIADGNANQVVIGIPNENDSDAQDINEQIAIKEGDFRSLKAPGRIDSGIPSESVEWMNIKFKRINFLGPNNWVIELPNGDVVERVTIRDMAFFDRVTKNGQEFKSDDMFKCKVEIITRTKLKKTTVKYNVLSVGRHRVAKDRKIIPDA